MENKELSFEECLVQLDELLKKLERSDVPLEEAVKCYTMGLELSKKAYDILNRNEALVVEKMTESGLVNFEKE